MQVSQNFIDTLRQVRYDHTIVQWLLENYPTITDPSGDFIDVKAKGFTYLPTARIEENRERAFQCTSKRVVVKYGKWIQRVYNANPDARYARPLELTQQMVERFSHALAVLFEAHEWTFDVVSGEDLRKWYHHSTNAEEAYALQYSCMRHDDRAPLLDIYVCNPNQINLAILTKNDKLYARCLIYHGEHGPMYGHVYGDDRERAVIKRFIHERFDGITQLTGGNNITLDHINFRLTPSADYLTIVDYDKRIVGYGGYTYLGYGVNRNYDPSIPMPPTAMQVYAPDAPAYRG